LACSGQQQQRYSEQADAAITRVWGLVCMQWFQNLSSASKLTTTLACPETAESAVHGMLGQAVCKVSSQS
jgi:hypothetical protein